MNTTGNLLPFLLAAVVPFLFGGVINALIFVFGGAENRPPAHLESEWNAAMNRHWHRRTG